MFLMIKINKEKHAKSTGIHDFSTTPKTFPQQHATHFLLSLHVKMSFCQGHFVRHLVPFGTEISRPFCQGILLSRHPFVKGTLLSRVIRQLRAAAKGSPGQLQMQKDSILLAHFATKPWSAYPKADRMGKPGQMPNKVFRPEIGMNSIIQKVAVLVHMLAAVKFESYVEQLFAF